MRCVALVLALMPASAWAAPQVVVVEMTRTPLRDLVRSEASIQLVDCSDVRAVEVRADVPSDPKETMVLTSRTPGSGSMALPAKRLDSHVVFATLLHPELARVEQGPIDLGTLACVLLHRSGPPRLRVTALMGDGAVLPLRVQYRRHQPPSHTSKADRPSLGVAPNPARGDVLIRYALQRQEAVQIGVFDVAGRSVQVLVDEERAAGEHTAVWDGRDGTGRVVARGAYFVELRCGSERLTERLVLVK